MFRTLFAGLAQWTYALREIAESHPAAISAGVWSEGRQPNDWAREDAVADEPRQPIPAERIPAGAAERIHRPLTNER